MTRKRILFDKFEFPKVSGLEYLLDEEKSITDYLFVNEPHDGFSMYFENGFPTFTVPENSERSYCLFEMKLSDRIIKFFCPEKHKNLSCVVWYFYVELFDERGVVHKLPGQVRVRRKEPFLCTGGSEKPKFLEILEQVKLNKTAVVT
ncbi:MAG: hypothetical protein IJV73_03490 [Clostridia bacterium]|nr:hypothetical protein [Clostridia bacterium]